MQESLTSIDYQITISHEVRVGVKSNEFTKYHNKVLINGRIQQKNILSRFERAKSVDSKISYYFLKK